MRTGMRILAAAALLTTGAAAARAEGPYDNSSSYWTKVERWQDCAWKRQYMPYPAFAYGPAQTCNYGPPAAQNYAPPPYPYYPYPFYR